MKQKPSQHWNTNCLSGKTELLWLFRSTNYSTQTQREVAFCSFWRKWYQVKLTWNVKFLLFHKDTVTTWLTIQDANFCSVSLNNSHSPSSHAIKRRVGKVCIIRSFTVPEYDRPTVGRRYFGTHILQLQPFSWADIIALLWIADQPSIVHSSLDLAILVLPLSLLLLCLLGLPA